MEQPVDIILQVKKTVAEIELTSAVSFLWDDDINGAGIELDIVYQEQGHRCPHLQKRRMFRINTVIATC